MEQNNNSPDIKSAEIGKSRLIQEEPQLDQTTPDKDSNFKNASLEKVGLFAFLAFVVVIIIGVVIRTYTTPMVNTNEPPQEVIYDVDNGEEIDNLGNNGLVEISDVEIEYEEPERAFHIERRQQFCANNVDESHRLYSEYIGSKNRQIMDLKPRNISDEQWIREKTVQGAYKENLGVRETNYYWEYPTTGGTFVDLMRIHKCEVFNPGGRIIPIVTVDEDGYIPEYQLGIMGLEGLSEEEMVSYIQYMISLNHEEEEVTAIAKKVVGDFLTVTVTMDYSGRGENLKLKKQQEAFVEGQYKLNIKTGMLTYFAEIKIREVELSPTPEL
jgi:hypothetical protein